MHKKMKIDSIRVNPENPRVIKDAKFKKLCQSIKSFPKMLELRPIIVDDSGMILGGNMRYQALKYLNYDDIPDKWVKLASDLSEDEKKQFIVKDNVEFGEWDFDVLSGIYDKNNLSEWGVDIAIENISVHNKEEKELRPYKRTHILLSFQPDKIDVVMSAIDGVKEYCEIEQQSN